MNLKIKIKMFDINVDESATSIEKITITSRIFNTLYSKNHSNYNQFSTIKCYKNLPSITTLEAKSINIIKIHKTIFFNLSNLINIDLHHNNLLKISKNFKLFKNLKSLKLDSNQISFIPSFIGDFTNLEIFTISSNLITYIPTSIKNLIFLKVLNFSNNKVERLPIELGQLESLHTLYMEGNYFTSIPTTLCYLKRLNELSFDWLEFVEPPYYRIIKDSVGKTIICIIIKCLETMLKQSLLYCDFKTFVEKISPKKNEEIEKDEEKTIKMSKSELVDDRNNFKFDDDKDKDKNTPVALYKINNNINEMNNKYNKIFYAIENNYIGVIKSFLESENVEQYLNIKNAENRKPFYLAINTKNDEIINLFLDKIIEKKIKLNYTYLFKAIRTRNPNLVKKLINLGITVNSTDDQGKGVFHMLFNSFTKQIAKCILIGDYLLEKGAPLNLYDIDNWAPIHIAASKSCKQCLLWIISSNKKLRKEGKEEFDLNLKGKNKWTPLHLTVSSYRIEETLILLEQGCDIFARNTEAKTPKKVCLGNFLFSKLLSNYEIINLREKFGKFCKNYEKEKCEIGQQLILKNIKTEYIFSIYSDKYKNLDEINKNNNNNFKLKRGITYNNIDFNLNNIINDINEEDKVIKSDKNNANKKKSKNKNEEKIKEQIINDDFNFKLPVEQEIANISSTFINEEPININIQKERILSNDSCLNEKYEAFMYIKLNKSCNPEIIKNLFNNMDMTNLININMISDLCNYILSNFMTNLIPCLKNLLFNKLLIQHRFIISEIKNTINILEKFQNNIIIPINKQKTKYSNKSMNVNNNKIKFDDEDNDGKFIQDSEIMNDELIEEDNDLNFEAIKEIWKNENKSNNI